MTFKNSKSWPIGLVVTFIGDSMAKKYIQTGPTDAELRKIEKESKDIYKMPLKDLFNIEDIEVQDSACDDYS